MDSEATQSHLLIGPSEHRAAGKENHHRQHNGCREGLRMGVRQKGHPWTTHASWTQAGVWSTLGKDVWLLKDQNTLWPRHNHRWSAQVHLKMYKSIRISLICQAHQQKCMWKFSWWWCYAWKCKCIWRSTWNMMIRGKCINKQANHPNVKLPCRNHTSIHLFR